MSDELKPCPLCNGSAIYKTKSAIDNFLGTQTVSCRECCASAPLHNWNSRPSRERLQQENAELRKALKSMIGKGIDLLNVEDVTDEEDAFSIHSEFNDAIINSQLLLNKNDN